MAKVILSIGTVGLEFKEPIAACDELTKVIRKHVKGTSKIKASNRGTIIYTPAGVDQVETALEV